MMTEAEWWSCTDPDDLLIQLEGNNQETDAPAPDYEPLERWNINPRKLSLFHCACYRRVWNLISDPDRKCIVLFEEKARGGCPASTPEDFGFSSWRAASKIQIEGGDIAAERSEQAKILRDLFGNPFRPVTFDPNWRTTTALVLARGIYDDRAFDRLPILADALQDAGCDNDDILNHLRDPHATHVRGCWALDLVLGKE